MSDDGKIVTTQEEIEAFFIVRSILHPHINISVDRLAYRDAQQYFSIIVDDNNVSRFVAFISIRPTTGELHSSTKTKRKRASAYQALMIFTVIPKD